MSEPLIPETAWPALQDEAVTFLQQLVKVHSINPHDATTEFPPVGESVADKLIQAKLKQDGIGAEILEAVPGRGNVIARLTGDGCAKPVLLLGHLDVAGVMAKDWKPGVDPFGGQIVDGRMYGRGTADMKDIVVIHAMTLLAIKRHGIKLKRDVILAGVADEEAGSKVGVRWLVANHWDKLDAEFALNEGFTGGPFFNRAKTKVIWVGLEAVEKRIMEAAIVATGHAGHASSEQADNSIYRLAEALMKLRAHPRPLVLNPVSAAFARAIQAYFGEDLLTDTSPDTRAFFHDAVIPTILCGGTEAIILPAVSRATLNCRLLPTTETGEFQHWLETVVAGPGVSVEYPLGAPPPAAPPSGPDNALVTAYTAAVRRQFGADIPVILTQGVGTTDSFYLREKGVQAYGIRPLADTVDEDIHGPNESIPVEAFKQGMRMIVETVLALAT